MKTAKPKILIITSVNPTVGPGVVALNCYNTFKEYDFDVDLMTTYPIDGYPEFISVLEKPSKFFVLIQMIKKKLQMLRHSNFLNGIRQKKGFYIFYKKESFPPVRIDKVINRITKKYDIVYILFWQDLLSFQTIDAIHNKIHCQIHFRCVDYSPMAGGCHFTGDCERYKTGCGNCPAIYSNKEEDFTRFNIKYRKLIYEKVKPIVYGNSYMQTFYDQSFLLKNYARKEQAYPLMNNDVFKPLNRIELKEKYHIPCHKQFLMFFGSQSLVDKRKGVSFLLDSLKILQDRLSQKERESILLLVAGNNIDAIKDKLCFDYRHLGFVKSIDLPVVYNLADVFLSPSINDAGPSMVNQSLSCGTPVVAFEMGTALDMVKDKNSGYCAKLRDSNDFANGIEYIFRLSVEDYGRMRVRCRDIALTLTSKEAFINRMWEIYEKYKVQ